MLSVRTNPITDELRHNRSQKVKNNNHK